MLDVLKKRGLTGAAIVVTRYFGGILLGAAGLVRAYSGSASMCVDKAGEAEIRLCRRCIISVDYTDSGRVRSFLEAKAGSSMELLLLDIEYGGDVRFTVSVVKDRLESIKKELVELTSSRALLEEGDEEYMRMTGEKQ